MDQNRSSSRCSAYCIEQEFIVSVKPVLKSAVDPNLELFCCPSVSPEPEAAYRALCFISQNKLLWCHILMIWMFCWHGSYSWSESLEMNSVAGVVWDHELRLWSSFVLWLKILQNESSFTRPEPNIFGFCCYQRCLPEEPRWAFFIPQTFMDQMIRRQIRFDYFPALDTGSLSKQIVKLNLENCFPVLTQDKPNSPRWRSI